MRHRVPQLLRIAAIAAAFLLTSACDDSGSPTEPRSAIAGAWTGTYSGLTDECEARAEATFTEDRGSVWGQISVTRPCGNHFAFRGTLQANTLEGEFTDFDGLHIRGRGTVSGGTLEIHLDGEGYGTSRMNFYR